MELRALSQVGDSHDKSEGRRTPEVSGLQNLARAVRERRREISQPRSNDLANSQVHQTVEASRLLEPLESTGENESAPICSVFP